ncbi:OLC1v1036466C1 [Oldenlandia corymbosa var. corymbosa]|uniref:OLC1v1036466C1 n=1 Tax=Oldenlandia corymbosa var. corymbosa TaxID=529605 RepID=A0AAV1CW87_OLDCO|nr:OLC1v1036466C1 [Oldenlandia corymbosa var. corymbosa]
MTLLQSLTTAHLARQGSMPIQTFALGGSSLPFPNILAVDSYSIVITDQYTGIGRQSSQQQSNVGSSLFGERSSYFGSYRSPGFQTPAFVPPPGNFTFDGRQLPPLSPQYGMPMTAIALLGIPNTMASESRNLTEHRVSTAASTKVTSARVNNGLTSVNWTRRSAQNSIWTIGDVGIRCTERQAGQNVQGTNDRRIILYQNRVPRNNNAAANLTDLHIHQGSGIVVADPLLEDILEIRMWEIDTTRINNVFGAKEVVVIGSICGMKFDRNQMQQQMVTSNKILK